MKRTLIVSFVVTSASIVSCVGIYNLLPTGTDEAVACPALPQSFEESDLVGTWVGRYFGDIDKLIIQADGTYKQIFSSDSLDFESEWQGWSFEYDPNGYGRLHLEGMRRCDDTDSICNNPGGGLPLGEVAINPCESEYVDHSNEVVLFVTGYSNDVPRGIVLRQTRLAGSDWNWGYQLQP
jgi:hypothetical protein